MGEPLHVSVVALDPVLEAGVTSALRACPDAVVLTPQEAAAVTVVIVDAVAPEVIDVVRAISGASHRPVVVLIAAGLAAGQALQAIAAGARGLLLRREATAAGVLRAVLAAANGDCVVPPGLLDSLLEHGVGCPAAAAAPDERAGCGPGLSDRERAVLTLAATGLDTAQIARELCYSTRTVTGIVHDITRRFELRNRAHAVAYALRAGLLVAAVQSAQCGEARIPYHVLTGLIDGAAASPIPVVALTALTARQRAVLALMAEGHGNAAIASMMSCSQHTIKNVGHDLMARLQVSNRSQAVACAIRTGLI